MWRQFLILLSLVFVVFCANCDLSFDSPHPSDEWLLKNFQANEKDFNLLAQMAEDDSGMVRISYTSTSTIDEGVMSNSKSRFKMTNERWNEYKKLFSKLGLKDGIVNNQPDAVYFYASSEGVIMGGSVKGYAYLKKEPEGLVNSLDDITFKNSNKSINTAYRKIKDKWYLTYEVD